MSNNINDWYWTGTPGLYGSKRAGLIVGDPTLDSDYNIWLLRGPKPTPWPKDISGNETIAALDEVLTAAGLPISGLDFPNIQATSLVTINTICNAISNTVYADQTDIASYGAISSIIIANNGIAPSSGQFATMISSTATQLGQTTSDFANMITTFTIAAGELQTARLAFASAVSTSVNGSQIGTALTSFMTTITSIIATLNAALPISLPTIAVPSIPTIPGV